MGISKLNIAERTITVSDNKTQILQCPEDHLQNSILKKLQLSLALV